MANRNFQEANIHDKVVISSANSYSLLRSREGLEVTVNPGQEKNRFIGNANDPLYPDVIVWKPDYIGSTRGQAVTIEEVETESSVTSEEANQWKKFGNLGLNFVLIVPVGYGEITKKIIAQQGVNGVNRIQEYSYNPAQGIINFIDI